MNRRTRLLATVSALTMFAGLVLVGSTPAGAALTFNVANDHVTCQTLTGTTKFANHLTSTGPTTGSNTMTVKLALAGCTDDDNSHITLFRGASTVTLTTNAGTNCAQLLGLSNVTGSAPIVWTPGSGQAFVPKTTVGTAQKAATNITYNQLIGGAFAVPPANAPWGASYGSLSTGAAYGTTSLSSSVDFTGGDGGASSWLTSTTNQDIGAILGLCASKGGLASLTFGIGAFGTGAPGNNSFPGSTTTCAANTVCTSPTVTSTDGSTSLQVTSAASPSGPQTLTLQVGGLSAMECSLPGSGSVVSEFHTTATDSAKIAVYKVFGDAATFANDFYAAHPDISGCYGSQDEFNGWSVSWATGTYVYGPAPFDDDTGLYNAFLGNCANHGGYEPCFVDTSDASSNTTAVFSPASASDPRVSH